MLQPRRSRRIALTSSQRRGCPIQPFSFVVMTTPRPHPRRAPERKESHQNERRPLPNVAVLGQGQGASLSPRRGIAILLLLSVVQFMDILDASILNIALP